MTQYYIVIGFFCLSMLAALLYTVFSSNQSFAEMPIIDEGAMLVHNGQGHRFTQASNEFFADWTIADAKKHFDTGLADNPNIEPCKSSQNTEMPIPESYDWRDENPECIQEPQAANNTCSASYVYSTLSAAQDRICSQGNKEPIRLSTQELIDCDKNSDCFRGYVGKVLSWGKRRGFVPE